MNLAVSLAETRCGGMHETRHDPGDGSQLKGLQTQQAADAEGGPHDGEAGEAAETGAGEEAQTETSGETQLFVFTNVELNPRNEFNHPALTLRHVKY